MYAQLIEFSYYSSAKQILFAGLSTDEHVHSLYYVIFKQWETTGLFILLLSGDNINWSHNKCSLCRYVYYLVNSPLISNNTDYHLKKNWKLYTDIFIITLIITFATIIILQKQQLYFNLSITVEPPLSSHSWGTGKWPLNGGNGYLIEICHKLA